MKRLSSTLLLLSFITIVFGQTPSNDNDTLDVNDMRVQIHCSGDIGWDLTSDPLFEVPKGSGKHTIFATNLWLGAVDASGNTRVAAQTYRQSGIDYGVGPLANVRDSSFMERYDQVFTVYASEVQTHITQYNQPGYVMPADLANWPGNGDTTNGEPFCMAPFEDTDNDRVYNPMNGDYPLFPGDQASYVIYSDAHFPNFETNGLQMVVDIHTLAYMYDKPTGDPVDQTLFVSHRIINRDVVDLDSVYMGIWTDFDLGDFRDDYLGCDTARAMYFCYNAHEVDGIQGSPGSYGNRPPAMGIVMLNQELSHFNSYFIPPQNPFTAFPAQAGDFYDQLSGSWNDGTSFTYGGNGYGGMQPTNHLFPGDPRDTSQWTMISEGLPAGDQRGQGSAGPFSLRSGASICLEIAYVFARGDDHLIAVEELKRRTDNVRDFYDSTTHACDLYACPQGVVDGLGRNEVLEQNVTLFPNPTSSTLYIQFPHITSGTMRIFDTQGKLANFMQLNNVLQTQYSVSDLPSGIYFVEIESALGRFSKKFVKE